MEKAIITYEEWKKNRKECENLIEKHGILSTFKKTEKLSLNYITWTIVWEWMKEKYPTFVFNIKEIKDDFVCGNLEIFGTNLGSLTLSREKQMNHITKVATPEATEKVQMRLFVKLVANITGFGFHLWEKEN